VKEEIRRIMNLVKEGKLSPEDAAELIDAFTTSDSGEEAHAENGAAQRAKESDESDKTDASEKSDEAAPKDPFKTFVDFMENIGKEVTQKVDWNDVAQKVRESSIKGMEALKKGVEQIKEGKGNWTWFSAYESREMILPLSVPEGKTLRIENPCGDVRLKGSAEKGEIHAQLKVRGGDETQARENADAFTLLVEESDHQVLIRQHDVPGIELDLDIKVLGTVNVEVRNASGDVELNDVGSCKVQSQAGDVLIRRANGLIEITCQSGDVAVEDSTTPSLTLESKSGDVSIKSVTGNISMRTASGDVSLLECSGKTISIESVSGDVSVDISEPVSGTVNVRTVNGEPVVAIADGSDCRVSLSTLRGDVLCDIDLEDEARLEQHVTGTLGKGTGSIDVSAVNGNVTMKLREHTATAAR